MRARSFAIASLVLTASQTLGCWAIHNREGDLDRSPVVNTGAGASIIYPGQSAPAHPGNYHPREAGYNQGVVANPNTTTQSRSGPGQSSGTTAGSYVPPGAVGSQIAVPPPEYAPGSGSASSSGTGAPRGSNISMLGGTEIEETRSVKISEEPKWLKYLALPFAVLAAPVKYGADVAAGDPVAAPALPRNETQPRHELRPTPAVTDYETARLEGLDRELEARNRTTAPAATTSPATAPSATGSNFSDELAALRRRANPAPVAEAPAVATAPAPATAPAVAPAPAPQIAMASAPAPSPVAGATGQVDRDGDGRTDHWITRENGAITREVFDENFDGRPDRTLVYDPASHEVVQIEEDTNFDGRNDTWTALRGGQVTGRRVDENGDGQIDSWSIFRGGVITRLERDTNGDGFRDRVALYQDGHLAREERDDDGDGRTDLITYYGADEHVERVEEDANDDGQMDVVSYYENGKLARREVLDASVLGQSAAPRATERQ